MTSPTHEQGSSCCGPRRTGGSGLPLRTPAGDVLSARTPAATTTARQGMVDIVGGGFRMGNADRYARPDDGEGPVRTVSVSPYAIDTLTVTNAEFESFVAATGYRTEAEQIGWSFVFDGHLAETARRHVLPAAVADTPWWVAVEGASWAAPSGPGSTIEQRRNHPVVHASWADANAYAAWAGKRLPTEAEWEHAARGGIEQTRYPWGDELTPGGEHRCNIWQGLFPVRNRGEDGYQATAPVRSFTPNGYGLYNTVGNVWEWCADWFSTTWHVPDNSETRVDPTGPPHGTERVIRGGSHLCHSSYCDRYRVAARTGNTPDSATSHTGFRCAGPSSSGEVVSSR